MDRDDGKTLLCQQVGNHMSVFCSHTNVEDPASAITLARVGAHPQNLTAGQPYEVCNRRHIEGIACEREVYSRDSFFSSPEHLPKSPQQVASGDDADKLSVIHDREAPDLIFDEYVYGLVQEHLRRSGDNMSGH